MKQTITTFLFIALLHCSAWAQIKLEDIPLESQVSKVFYSDNDISTKMSNAKTWIAKTFGDYKSVLQFEDNDKNRIIIKGVSDFDSHYNFNTGGKSQQYINYTITFDFKEDKFRIQFDDITIHETKTLYRGGMVHDTDWPLNYLEPSVLAVCNVRELTQQLDSLNNMKGLSKQEQKKVERQKKKIQKELVAREEELAIETAKSDAKITRYKQIICDLFNRISMAIAKSDDF